jgi:hypothetical protein
MFVSENKPAVALFFLALRALCPRLFRFGYDDWCHFWEWLQGHMVTGLEDITGFIDRTHQRGHKRWACHTAYAADVRGPPSTHAPYQLRSSVQVTELLARFPETRCGGPRIYAVEVPAPDHSLTAGPPSLALSWVVYGALPVRVVFQQYGATPAVPPILREILVTTELQREELKKGLNKLTGVAHSRFRLHGVWVQQGARLVRVESTTGDVLAENHSEKWLRKVLRAQTRFPVTVVIAHTANTQVAEQGWRVLNRFQSTLMYLQPQSFAYVLDRILHELNKEIWGGVPPVCAHPVPWLREH